MANNFNDAFSDMFKKNNELLACGIEMFKLFNAYTQAGFTEDQALKLIANTMAAFQQTNKN